MLVSSISIIIKLNKLVILLHLLRSLIHLNILQVILHKNQSMALTKVGLFANNRGENMFNV